MYFICILVFSPQCPFIYPITFATTNESSALIIRMFNEKGTLRDHICKVRALAFHTLARCCTTTVIHLALSTSPSQLQLHFF